MIFRNSAVAVAAAILFLGAAPAWAGQSHQYPHHAKVQNRNEVRHHEVTRTTPLAQEKVRVLTAPAAGQVWVGVGPQASAVRIRDLAMAPTG